MPTHYFFNIALKITYRILTGVLGTRNKAMK